MGESERSLTSLGRHVAELQDGAPEAQLDRAAGRARLLREGAAARERPVRWRPLLAAALAAAMVAAVFLVLARRGAEALRFDVGAAQAGAVGAWIAAPPGTALPIRFSDGSELVLAPEGRARVASVSADGAEIALERGSLDLSIVHRETTRWTLRLGPFQVHVVGTRFEASWDPVTERCTVALREGAITVSGPVVGDSRPMHAGERLVISAATGTLEASRIDTATAPAPGSAAPAEPEKSPEPPVPHPPEADSNTPRSPPASHSAAPREASTWRALARDGRYKDALAAADHEGFDAICASASASDLHALADAARLGGDATRAARAFMALRERFPGSAEAASAAFILGRTAQDRSKDHASAAAWFTQYLREQPAGAFAAEAAGRLVEAKDRAGDAAGARAAAERYLAAYPSGSHAAYARNVLARGQDAGAPEDASAPMDASAPADAGAP